MDALVRDLRHAARSLRKSPGFTTVAVLTLALGIGANTAIFSVVNAVLLRPLPYPEPERLAMVWEKRVREGVFDNVASPADFRDWRERNRVFEHPQENTNHGAWVVPLQEQWVGDVRPALLVLLGAAGAVLLIAGANVAGLHLVRGAARRKEMVMRAALGASRARLVGQVLTESLLLSAVSGAAAVLFALWGVELLALLISTDVVLLNGARMDLRVFGFTILVTLAAGVLTGLAAAWETSRQGLNDVLKEAGRGAAGGPHRGRHAFVVAQIAVAIVLVAGAGLMLRSLFNLRQVPLGFEAANVLTAHISLPSARYPEREQAALAFRQLLDRLEALPGVRAAGAAAFLPLDGGDSRTGIAVEGRQHDPDEPTRAHPRVVTPGYFHAMRIRLVSGRFFTDGDGGEAAPVAIVNETAARRSWPSESPLGKRLRVAGTEEWREIVGVIGDVRHWGVDVDPSPELYLSWHQFPQWGGNLVLRADVNPASLAGPVRHELQQIDRDQPLARVLTMERVVAASLAQPRSYATLLGVFAGVALLLAAIGIYGVMAHSVAQRTHEIGVRMALGAQPRDVLRLVVGRGVLLAALGVAIGLAPSLALTRVMGDLLFRVEPGDPPTLAAVAAVLGAVALLASYIPARRAARVDPVEALRAE